MTRWGMVIDLARCVGCHSCAIACKVENGTPKGVLWGKVLEKEVGTYPTAKRIFLPVLCNHCKEPACVAVCPSGATSQRDDGIVTVDYAKCIGCRYCMMACPFNVRIFMDSVDGYFGEELTPYEQVRYKEWYTGTVTKCTFCVHRIDRGKEPRCVETCPCAARTFGDLDDPNSEVSKLIRNRDGRPLRPEAGTEPSIYYLGMR
ncbi:MAG: 4Fe-4S dicluster domain-containing protein [Chloroflexi bacterium]|nr:4Fe-4S dicluster domain-containing protein [Chloroflexota bacterium]